MRFNQNVFKILTDESESIEEKCYGYNENLKTIVILIVASEIQHSIKGTNIQQRINSLCNDAGDFLYKDQTKIVKGDI